MNFKFQSLRLKLMLKTFTLLLTTLLVLTGDNMRLSMAESEISDLNSLDFSKQSNLLQTKNRAVSKLEAFQYPSSYNGYMPPRQQSQYPSQYSPPAFAGAPPPYGAGAGTGAVPGAGGCPLCDSSVYSYCSHKLVHDSCCCDFPGAVVYQKPPQCAYFDCSLLYAKSCYEHSLIKNCCCNNPY